MYIPAYPGFFLPSRDFLTARARAEHRHTAEVLQCLKIITIPGCERIIRYALDYARTHGRKKVTCVTKSNIMKLTDGAFQKVFVEMARAYPDLQTDHQIVDIATARVAASPHKYDVVVTLNLYGDILRYTNTLTND